MELGSRDGVEGCLSVESVDSFELAGWGTPVDTRILSLKRASASGIPHRGQIQEQFYILLG